MRLLWPFRRSEDDIIAKRFYQDLLFQLISGQHNHWTFRGLCLKQKALHQ